MAAPNLPTLVPTSFDSQSGTTWTTTTVDNIDNTVASPDGAFIVAGANSTSSIFYAFTDMPSDFVKILTLNYNIRYKIESLAGDTETLFIQVFASDKTTTYTNEATVVSTTANIAITNKGSTALTLTANGLAASQSNWNGAFIRIRTTHSANMGSDGSVWSIDEVELTGTYDVAPTTVLGAPSHASGVSSLVPQLFFTGTDANSDTIEYNLQLSSVIDSLANGTTSGYSLGGGVLRAQTFTPTSNVNLDAIVFCVVSNSGVTGTIKAHLYATSGGAPSGSPLATSDIIDASVCTPLGGNLNDNFIYFPFSSSQALTASTTYAVVLELVDTSGSATVIGDTAGGHSGKHYAFTGSWTEITGTDLIFYVCTRLLNKLSVSDSGFTAGHPFTSGQEKSFTVQSGDSLTNGLNYLWAVKATDPSGTNTYGPWGAPKSFTVVISSGKKRILII